MRAFALAMILLAAGCAPRGVREYRVTSQVFPRDVESVRVVYQGDLPALEAAGGFMIAELVSTGSRFTVNSRAERYAARIGGTHLLLLDDTPRYLGEQVTYRQTYSGSIRGSTHGVYQPTARWAVYRVPVERRSSLPNHLRL